MLPPDDPAPPAISPRNQGRMLSRWCPHPPLGSPCLVLGPAWLCHPTWEHRGGPWDSSSVRSRRVISKAIGDT